MSTEAQTMQVTAPNGVPSTPLVREAGEGETSPRVTTRRMRRIVVGSLLVGWVMAGILTLWIFAGAQEHAITGSALLGFSSGWAMLALLSTRMTSRPQRWAVVPAIALAATGLGLLALAPNDRSTSPSAMSLWPSSCLGSGWP
jgi:hypothetical protein